MNSEPEIYDTNLCAIDFSSTAPNNLLTEIIGVRQVLVSGVCNGVNQDAPAGPDEDEQTLSFNPLTNTLSILNGNSVVIPLGTGTTVQNNSYPTNISNPISGLTQVNTGNGLMGGPITSSGTIEVDAPTCAGTDKLQWNGTAFVCSPDIMGGGVNSVTASGPILSSGGTTPNISLAACPAGQSYVHDGSNWVCQAAPTAITVQNGLTDIGGGIVELGGSNPLLHDTDIISDGNNLNFTGTGRFGIGTNTPEFKLDIDNDGVNGGGIIARGTFGSGATLTTNGAGERLIWDPATGAFRAGGVSGNQWDLANIGIYSFAAGQDNLVSGSHSAAFGSGNNVAGNNSFASGTANSVLSNFSNVFGLANTVNGAFATAMGLSSSATGTAAFASGSSAAATGNNSVAIGTSVSATAQSAIAMGANSTASGQSSTAIGFFNNVSGFNSTAVGFNNQLNSDNGFAFGYQNTQAAAIGDAYLFGLANTANSGTAVLVGTNNVANGGTSVVAGFQNTTNGQFSNIFGRLSTTTGDFSSAFGTGLTSQGYSQTVLGRYNVASGTQGSLVQTDEGLVFGNGTSLGNESNAFSISWQGRTTMYGTSAIVPVSPAAAGSIYFDANTNTFQCSENGGAYFDCFGGSAAGVTDINGESGSITLSGDSPITVGNVGPAFSVGLAPCASNQTYVYVAGNWLCSDENLLYYDESNNVPGVEAAATGTNAVAIGDSATAGGNFSTAIGWATSANGFRSQAYGMANTAGATATNSQLFGFNNNIDTFDTVSVGWSNTSTNGGELNIFGRNNTVNGADSTVVGYNNTTTFGFSEQYLYGSNLTSSADNTHVFGNGITNNVANSLMVGPNSSNILSMLSTGEMGFGNIDPTSRVDISGALTMRGMPAPGLSPLGQGRIYFDSTANEFLCSENNGAYFDCFGAAAGVTSVTAGLGMVNSGTASDPILDVQAVNAVRIDATNDAVMFGGPVNSGLAPLIENTQVPQAGFSLAFLGNTAGDMFGIGTNSTGTNLNERLDVVGNIENIADVSLNPEFITTTATASSPTSIQVVGNRAYVTNQSSSNIQAFDVSDPSTPTSEYIIGTNSQSLNFIASSGRYIYGAGRTSGVFQVIDTYNNGVAFNTVKGTLVFTGFQITGIAQSGNNVIVILDDLAAGNNDFLAIVDVSNPSYPRETGRIAFGVNTNPNAVDVQGGIAYVALSSPTNQVRAVDVNVTEAPTLYPVYSAPICNASNTIKVYGKFAFVGCVGSAQISIIDISNPNVAAPATVATINAGGPVSEVEVSGRYLFATVAGIDELRMWDIRLPSSPTLIGNVSTGGTTPSSLDVSGRHVYVTNQVTNTMAVIDIHGIETTSILAHSVESGQLNVDGETNLFGRVNIASNASVGSNLHVGGDVGVTGNISTLINGSMTPSRIGNLDLAPGNNTDFVLNGNYAYIIDQTGSALRVINISNPALPVAVGVPISTGLGSSPRSIAMAGRYAYTANDNSSITIFDITNPSAPVLISTFAIPTTTGLREIIATDRYLYATGLTSNAVFAIDVSNPRAPRIVSTVTVCTDPTNLAMQEKYLVVGCSQAIADNVQIWDYSNILSPSFVSSISVAAPGPLAVVDLDIQGNFIYTVTTNGIQIHNISTITTPVTDFASGTFFGGAPVVMSSVLANGRYVYATMGNGPAGNAVWFAVDITSSVLPRIVSATFSTTAMHNRALIVRGKNVYTVNNNPLSNSIEIFDVNGVETSTLVAHSAQAGQLVVQNDASIVGNLTVAGGTTFAGNVGVNGDATINGQLNVTGRNPVSVGLTNVGMSPSAVTTSGRYLYMGSFTGGRIFDISDPTAPILLSSPAMPTTSRAIIQGHYIYTSFGTTFTLSSIANPNTPVVLSNLTLSVANRAFDIQGKYAYMMKSNGEMDIIDISSTQTMNIISSTMISPGTMNDIKVRGRYVYITHPTSTSLIIYDISNPLAPVSVGSVVLPSVGNRIALRESYAYVTHTNGFYTVDITNPATPTLVHTVAGLGGAPVTPEISGKNLYLFGTTGVGLRVYDISSPAVPQFVGTTSTGFQIPSGKIQGRYAYASDTTNTALRVLDLGGAYVQQLEASGVETDSVVARGDVTANSGIFKNGISVSNSMNVLGDSNVRGKLTVGLNNAGPASGVFQEGSGYAFSVMAGPNPVSTENAIAAFTNLNPANSLNNTVMRLSMGATPTGGNTNPRFIRFFAGLSTGDTGGTAVGSISLNGASGVSFNTSGADFGEYYTIVDDAQVGEIVAVTRDGNRRGVKGEKILGVVSDTAGFVGNSIEYTSEGEIPADRKIVGLLGQMKVKVNGESGAIEAGDFVALSSTAGVGMKATANGMVLGKAMESSTCDTAGCESTIMIAVQPTWYVPELEGLLMGESNGDSEESDTPISSISMEQIVSYLTENTLEILKTNNLTVNSRFNLNGSLYLSGNNTGRTVIPVGQTSVTVNFASVFEGLPNVVLTQNSFIEGKYRVTNVTNTGFTIELENIQVSDVEFTWLGYGTL